MDLDNNGSTMSNNNDSNSNNSKKHKVENGLIDIISIIKNSNNNIKPNSTTLQKAVVKNGIDIISIIKNNHGNAKDEAQKQQKNITNYKNKEVIVDVASDNNTIKDTNICSSSCSSDHDMKHNDDDNKSDEEFTNEIMHNYKKKQEQQKPLLSINIKNEETGNNDMVFITINVSASNNYNDNNNKYLWNMHEEEDFTNNHLKDVLIPLYAFDIESSVSAIKTTTLSSQSHTNDNNLNIKIQQNENPFPKKKGSAMHHYAFDSKKAISSIMKDNNNIDIKLLKQLLEICLLLQNNKSKQEKIMQSNDNGITNETTAYNNTMIHKRYNNEKIINDIIIPLIMNQIIYISIIIITNEDNNDDYYPKLKIIFQVSSKISSSILSPDTIPLRTLSLNSFSNKKNNNNYYYAKLFRIFLSIFYPHSLINDIVQKQQQQNGTKKKNEEEDVAILTSNTIYSIIDNQHCIIEDEENNNMMEIPKLKPILRPYQTIALQWMISREQIQPKNDNYDDNSFWKLSWLVLYNNKCIPLYEYARKEKNENDNDDLLYYNPFSGWLVQSIAIVKRTMMGINDDDDVTTPLLRGGILADEMGLGKTIEVLALILKYTYDDNNEQYNSFNNDSIILPIENNDTRIQDNKEKDNAKAKTRKTVNITVSNALHSTLQYYPYNKENNNNDSNSDDNNIIEKICLCGVSNNMISNNTTTKNNWVQCPSCNNYLHESCAGYTTKYKYNCQSCVANSLSSSKKLINSKATLIITPSSILDQWVHEINHHVNSIKVLIYPGIKEMCFAKNKSIPDISLSHVRNLIDADIILTTFEALMSDFHHITEESSPNANARKRKKRYRILPSPLPYINFWRCCIDEAQRVEISKSNCTKLINTYINSSNKWCITGTPIRSKHANASSGSGAAIDDIYGLLVFLGIKVSIYNEKKWFNYCFKYNYTNTIQRLQYLFSTSSSSSCKKKSFIVRRTKKNKIIQKQMNIPIQMDRRILLKFSSIEKHFYNKLLEETIVLSSESANKGNELLSRNILRLRASCCHPQVGTSTTTNTNYFGISRINNNNKRYKNKMKKSKLTNEHFENNNALSTTSIATGVLSMDQILDRLIDDAKTKCEESQRIVILHSNALASLYRLKVEVNNSKHNKNDDNNDNNKDNNKSGDGDGDGDKDSSSYNKRIVDGDKDLFYKSIEIYKESLNITNNNAIPCDVVGEAIVHGCAGFMNNYSIIRDGRATLQWNFKPTTTTSSSSLQNCSSSRSSNFTPREVWTIFDFEGPAKKITALNVRPIITRSSSTNNIVIIPKKCILQVSNASIDGEFINVCEIELSVQNDWVHVKDFRTNKSKNWRFVIQTYHNYNIPSIVSSFFFTTSIELQFLEPQISTDDLQRMHIIHNIAMTLDSLLQIDNHNNHHDNENQEEDSDYVDNMSSVKNNIISLLENNVNTMDSSTPSSSSKNTIISVPHNSNNNNNNDTIDITINKETLYKMNKDLKKLEELYLRTAHITHKKSQFLLQQASNIKYNIQGEIHNNFCCTTTKQQQQSKIASTKTLQSVSLWWKDLISWCSLNQYEHNYEIQSLLVSVREDIRDNAHGIRNQQKFTKYKKHGEIPYFNDITGLLAVLTLRIQDDISISNSTELIQNVNDLSEHPSLNEISENSQCKTCRADWNQIGPTCRHCKLETQLVAFEEQLNDLFIDVVLKSLVKSLTRIIGENSSSNIRSSTTSTDNSSFFTNIKEMSKIYFKWHEARKKELYAAKLAWRAHFDLLSDLDELNQTKTTLRLLRDDESMSQFTEFELNGIVLPSDIPSLMMDHENKQCMALAQLRRGKETLRFLRNQSKERELELQKKNNRNQNDASSMTSSTNTATSNEEAPTCALCLNKFEGERAVLACGHYFHYSPCLEALISRAGGGSNKNISISCPMRCSVRTYKDQIMIATDKSKNDGSRNAREIKGSWGTKVDRLVSDVMDVIEKNEKSIIFSQWDDMLIIVGKALEVNHIEYVRPKTRSKMGGVINTFRNGNVPVLLLNVKSGAEGLTLVEATVEPLLHCGLDLQAINRVHRIGQTSKTYVHRYIIKDTIEEKIDKLRMERQNQLDKEIVEERNGKINAGGIDGGFHANELKEILNVS